MLHDGLDLCQALNTGQSDGLDCILVVAVFFIHCYHCIPQGHVFGLVVCCSLAQCNGCGNRVFIAGIGADQAAVALFHTEHIMTNTGALLF